MAAFVSDDSKKAVCLQAFGWKAHGEPVAAVEIDDTVIGIRNRGVFRGIPEGDNPAVSFIPLCDTLCDISQVGSISCRGKNLFIGQLIFFIPDHPPDGGVRGSHGIFSSFLQPPGCVIVNLSEAHPPAGRNNQPGR